uniref:CSON011267 protein n=1 Tax=Culicoides sonorensis TaxID=179676 RepID=A0A336LF97_CULSO
MAEVFNITDLPLIPLEHIFTFLTPSDRRICSLVSKQFHDVWMAKKFSSDRWLCFDGCVIEKNTPPMSVLMKSERAYHNLYIDNIKLIDKDDALWNKLGETVTFIKTGLNPLFYSSTSVQSMLDKFKVLKTIDFGSATLQRFDFGNQEIDMFSTNIEEIIIRKVFDQQCHHNFLKFMSRLKNLELHDVFVNDSTVDLIKNYEEILTHLDIEFGDASDSQILQLSGKNIKILKIRGQFQKIDIFLQKLDQNFPHLKSLHIETDKAFPTLQLEKLKSIHIETYSETQTIDQLKRFPNLKQLELYYERDPSNCFFGHEHFQMEFVESLKMEGLSGIYSPCTQCFNAVIRSFPNLTRLESDLHIQTESSENMKKFMPKLNFLSVSPGISISRNNNLELNLSSSFSNLNTLKLGDSFVLVNIKNWPVLRFLRKLSLRKGHKNLNKNDLFELIEKIPSLENLELSYCLFQKTSHLCKFLDEVAKICKRLECFYLTEGYNENVAFKIIKKLAINCEFIKTIKFQNVDIVFEISENEREYLAQIFKGRTSLRMIHVFNQTFYSSIVYNRYGY